MGLICEVIRNKIAYKSTYRREKERTADNNKLPIISRNGHIFLCLTSFSFVHSLHWQRHTMSEHEHQLYQICMRYKFTDHSKNQPFMSGSDWLVLLADDHYHYSQYSKNLEHLITIYQIKFWKIAFFSASFILIFHSNETIFVLVYVNS